MTKAAKVHFDCAALCKEVKQQDVGLRISTNDPKGFRRILYAYMRDHPEDAVHIYQTADAPNSLLLLNDPHPELESQDA